MTTTTTTALEPKTVRLPRLRRSINRARTAVTLAYVWVEVWPAALVTTMVGAHYTPTSAPAVCAALVTLAIWWRAHATGALAANVTDTISALVHCGWRNAEMVTWQLPHLISVRTHDPIGPRSAWRARRIEGRHAVPAKRMELVVRPNDSQGAEAWAERFGDWIARHYGFESVDILPWPESTNCLSITLSARTIPAYVGS